jgi:hypothetical protein
MSLIIPCGITAFLLLTLGPEGALGAGLMLLGIAYLEDLV